MTSKNHASISFPELRSPFDKQDKMQLLAKFKKNSVRGVQTHLKIFEVALNVMYRIFLNFAKACILSFLPQFDSTSYYVLESAGNCFEPP